jgi:hypothetical protein
MFALAVSNVTCQDGAVTATVTATRIVDPKSSDMFWGEDLQIDYIVSNNAAHGGGDGSGAQWGETNITLSEENNKMIGSVDIAFKTPFNANPTFLASVLNKAVSTDSIAISVVKLSAATCTLVLELIDQRHANHSTAPRVVSLMWLATTAGMAAPTLPPTAAPTPMKKTFVWGMDKLGELVDPLNLVDGGSKGLSGISSGVLFARQLRKGLDDQWERIYFSSVDAALVTWGKPNPFPTPIHDQPNISEGASFLLWDNIWNTNYINWWPYSESGINYGNSTFRFAIHFLPMT